MDPTDNKRFILNFRLPDGCPENRPYTRVLLQLFGYAGHGKSAFVNSCIYTLGSGEFRTHATTGSSGNIITVKRNSYELTNAVTIVDNRGFGKKDGFEEAMVYAQLGDFLPLDENVVQTNDFLQILSLVEDSEPNYTDFIVPIFVYSVMDVIPSQQVEEVERFFKNCKDMTGVAPIVVLTHKLKGNYKDLEDKFKSAGAEVVMAIENYTPEDHLKTRGRCADIQNVIVNALKDVNFRLELPRDPVDERKKRKKFLLKFSFEFKVQQIKEETETKAKIEEYNRLRALADKNWFYKFPYGK